MQKLSYAKHFKTFWLWNLSWRLMTTLIFLILPTRQMITNHPIVTTSQKRTKIKKKRRVNNLPKFTYIFTRFMWLLVCLDDLILNSVQTKPTSLSLSHSAPLFFSTIFVGNLVRCGSLYYPKRKNLPRNQFITNCVNNNVILFLTSFSLCFFLQIHL